MLHKAEDAVNRIAELMSGALLLAIAAILLLQVASRHVLAYPLPWPEEMAGFLFVWLIFIGAIRAYRSGGLIGIDWLIGKLPPVPRDIVRLSSDVVVILLLVGLIWTGIEATIAAIGSRTTMLRFSWAWVYLAFPIGCAMLLLSFVSTFLREAGDLLDRLSERRGGDGPEGRPGTQ